jgi:predicted glutamine amidotransferase
MCRLLGVIANKPVDVAFSLPLFHRKTGSKNQDGWGVAWYEGNVPFVKKAPLPVLGAKSQPRIQPLLEKNSNIFIAHVRLARTEVRSENTHPFQFGTYTFAHNGRAGIGKRKTGLDADLRSHVKGTTSSEKIFYWLIQNIRAEKDIFTGIVHALRPLKAQRNGLNFLLSDGKELFAFRYSQDSSHTLFLLERSGDNKELDIKSQQTRLLLHSKDLAGEKVVIVCSERLTDENWQEVKNGTLIRIGEDLKVKRRQMFAA